MTFKPFPFNGDPNILTGRWFADGNSEAAKAFRRENPDTISIPFTLPRERLPPNQYRDRYGNLHVVPDASPGRSIDLPTNFSEADFAEFRAFLAERRVAREAITQAQFRRGGGLARTPGGGWRNLPPRQQFIADQYQYEREALRALEPRNPFLFSVEPPDRPPTQEQLDAARTEIVAARGRKARGEPPLGSPPPAPADRFPETEEDRQSGDTSLPARIARNSPGTATASQPLPNVTGRWLRGSEDNLGLIPGQVAAKLAGRQFRNWRHFREEFWRAVAETPELADQFSAQNLGQMRRGYAPEVRETQVFGGQETYQLHHRRPLGRQGATYDMSNIIVVTPLHHRAILDPSYHYGSRP